MVIVPFKLPGLIICGLHVRVNTVFRGRPKVAASLTRRNGLLPSAPPVKRRGYQLSAPFGSLLVKGAGSEAD